jgi:hypothetical protein
VKKSTKSRAIITGAMFLLIWAGSEATAPGGTWWGHIGVFVFLVMSARKLIDKWRVYGITIVFTCPKCGTVAKETPDD